MQFTDYKALFDMSVNKVLRENKEIAPYVELCNKYGIIGMDVFSFLGDLATLADKLKAGEGK